MRYCLMVSDGQYIESNFTLIVINAHQAGSLGDLVVLKENSTFHFSLGIDYNVVVIVDKNKKFLDKNLSLVTVDEVDIQEDYLEYLNRHEMDGTPKSNCCNSPIVENTDLCSDCKEHSEPLSGITIIKNISNVYLDTFKVIEEHYGIVNFLNKYGIRTFQDVIFKIKKYLLKNRFTILHRKSIDIDFEKTLGNAFNSSDSTGKFAIIKNIESYINIPTTRPIKVFAEKDDIGYIIGNKGSNIKSLMIEFNKTNKHWTVPYITVTKLEERDGNDLKEIEKEYFKLIEIIFLGE